MNHPTSYTGRFAPSPSGPRCAMASHIAFPRAGSTGLGVPQWKRPAIPHMARRLDYRREDGKGDRDGNDDG